MFQLFLYLCGLLYHFVRIMKLNIFGAIIVVMLLGTACSGYNKLLKSTDVDAKYKEAIRLYHEKKYDRALGLFENIQPNLTGTLREDTMLFYMGKSHYNSKDYSVASEVFNVYRDRFTRSQFAEEAEYLYAMCYYHMVPSPEKDQSATRQAIVSFNEYLNRYPASIQKEYVYEIIESLTSNLYYKTYANAALYHKLGRYNGAIVALRSALKEHPEIPYKEEMMYLVCKSWFDYAENSVFARQLDRYLKMTDAYYNFLTVYPNSKQFSKELKRMFDKAQEFTDKHGVEAQLAQKDIVTLEHRKENIAKAKDKLFTVDTKLEREQLKKTIQEERAAIKLIYDNKKKAAAELKLEKKLLNNGDKKSNAN